MNRFKMMFAALVIAAIAGFAPQANATVTVTLEASLAGSSAQWQSLALGAYNILPSTYTKGHWTSASNAVNLEDLRTNPVNNDAGTVWVVWGCSVAGCASGTIEYYIFNKVDSVVGDRCFFAVPACRFIASSGTVYSAAGAGKIKSYLFSDGSSDSLIPSALLTQLNNGIALGGAATDIRPEDAAFAMCRANSKLGAGTVNTGDGLDGLGYNSNWASGLCPAHGSASSAYVGSPVTSGQPGAASNDQANVISFNLSGTDPISGTAIPAWTVVNVGAAPVVFVTARSSATGLKNVTNATPAQLQAVFSGTNCDATAFGVTGGTGLNIMLREPTSGTMNTTEATVFRGPTVNASGGSATIGLSQETGIGGTNNNPLTGQSGTCTSASGTGARYRAIGTGEEVAGVAGSNSSTYGGTGFATQQDGIGYTFFSFGNVAPLADSTAYGYITLNGVDPIYATYSTPNGAYDPGQSSTPGFLLAGSTDLKNVPGCNSTNGFPCAENVIWKDGLSFPNVRNGSYSSWSLLRVIAPTSGGQLTAIKALVAKSQANVVSAVPDYISYAAVTCTSTSVPACATEVKDPGLLVLRAHYQQKDGSGNDIGGAPENFTKTGASGYTEAGGDMGGEVFTCATQTTCPNSATVGYATGVYTHQSQQVVEGFNGGGFVVRP